MAAPKIVVAIFGLFIWAMLKMFQFSSSLWITLQNPNIWQFDMFEPFKHHKVSIFVFGSNLFGLLTLG